MTIEIEEEFINAAIDHGYYTNVGESIKINKAYDQIIVALNKIKQQLPSNGKNILLKLLNNQNSSVRRWAATYLLPLEEDKALSALEGLANEVGIGSFDAEMVLKLWETGELILPDWP